VTSSTSPTAVSEAPAERRWRLDLAYDGTEFSGWAIQPGFRTVQGELEAWLTRLLPVPTRIPVVCAGRTDAGVHARGQVVHFDLPADLMTDGGAEVVRRLSHVLPDDIVVSRLGLAPPGFHARFSALWRRYAYRISEGSVLFDPLLRHTVTRVPDPLDLAAMNQAAADILLGFRDFGAFCKRKAGGTSIRTLLELEGRRTEAGILEFTVRADAFCHSMVRSLIGALVSVGSGRRDRAWLAAVTRAAARDSTVRVMPPGGLTLEEVRYPEDDRLGARALETQTMRELVR
jgi:tRNA pseudouridine38-40 synthase